GPGRVWPPRPARHGTRVFCSTDDRPLTQREVQGFVARAAGRANLRHVGVHVLRHTFCSHLSMRGAPVRAIQELAGHQGLGTTQRYICTSAQPRSKPRSGCWTSATPSLGLETSLTTSALSRDTVPAQAAGAGSQKPRVGGGGRVSSVRTSSCRPSTLAYFTNISDGVAYQTSLRSQRTMMIRANSRSTGGGSPIHFAGHRINWTISPRRHPRIQASPRRRWCWCATAELVVID